MCTKGSENASAPEPAGAEPAHQLPMTWFLSLRTQCQASGQPHTPQTPAAETSMKQLGHIARCFSATGALRRAAGARPARDEPAGRRASTGGSRRSTLGRCSRQ